MADTKKGVELAKSELVQQVMEGKTYWFNPSMKTAGAAPGTRIHMLPNYDEYFIAYKDRSAVSNPWLFMEPSEIVRYLYGYIVVRDGLVIGGWKRRIEKDRVVIEVKLPLALDRRGREALRAVSEQYSSFIGKPVELTLS
jgi:winged helix DNA-binding protein